MTKIRKVEIRNFRGVRKLDWLPSPGVNCLIGPGDTGKSTVLDAIDLCLGARRNIVFADTDFHRLDVEQPISVTLTLGALDDELLSLDAYGLFHRGMDPNTGGIEDEPRRGLETVLTLNLTVRSDLEPVWSLQSDRSLAQGVERGLSWKDRQKLSPTRIGALAEHNLAWQRGSVLHRISDERADASTALIAAGRHARQTFGTEADVSLAAALETVHTTAKDLGVPVGEKPHAMLDAHSVSFNGGTIALHDGDGIPLKAMGVGSTRLLVAGLQREAAPTTTAVLADEVEYGLEPHRIGHFLVSLGCKEANPPLQAFMTSHSPVVLRELSGAQLFVVRKDPTSHTIQAAGTGDEIQSTLRIYPEAFLAPRIVVCEGASEVGLLRGLDQHSAANGWFTLASKGVAFVDSGGGTPDKAYARATVFRMLGYKVLVLRDDDDKPTPSVEKTFLERGGRFMTWSEGFALEDELFASVSESCVQKMLAFAVELHGQERIEGHLTNCSGDSTAYAKVSFQVQTGFLTPESRALLGKASRTRKAGWFKSITWMETVARDMIFPQWQSLRPAFCQRFLDLHDWANG
ncbi:ATP-dependent endonuclease [Paraburkholderia sabiae]|uniref:ATP-dependent nuclease n=1 Tax=Paraburkholderia sabiae TaxID=273251 RepID=UPI001CAEE48B|nr:ATP-binding protein [Paraburkholderia sabiae]CAG9225646.1 ATP-dependent endonuclease [Paraburkholderia sabiae]